MLITVVGFSTVTNAQSGIQKLDERTLEYLAAHRTIQQTKFWSFIANSNNYVNTAVPVGLLTIGWIKDDQEMRQNALYVATSTATTAILNVVLKKIFRRPRPFVKNIQFNAVYHPSSFSFPSGHSSSAFSTAVSLSRAYPKWYVIAPAMLWAGSVGYSRMYLGVHYPSDVFTGAALGTGSAFAFDFLRK